MSNSKVKIDHISTEKQNSNSEYIDRASTLEMVEIINKEDQKVAISIQKELPAIANAVDLIFGKLQSSGRLFYIGAGTSGRLGVLDASECPPTYGVSPELVQGIIVGGKIALYSAVEQVEDDKEQAVKDLKNVQLCKNDVLVGIAASGRTPYVIGAMEYAKSINVKTIGISSSLHTELSSHVDIPIEVYSGPEVVSGSTRMKAGTTQKLILNMLSTATMIKLGKVYKNLMIDVQPSNKKLIERCKKIVMEVCNCDYSIAQKTLEETKYNVKLASLMIKKDLSKEKAKNLLNENNGYLFKALGE